MRIEMAVGEDISAICLLDSTIIGNQSRRNKLRQSVAENHCVMAKIDDELAGFAIYDGSFFGYCFISLVIVSSSVRRKGVASALIKYVEKNSTTEKIFTSTNESNIAMQKVCESLGYTRSGIIENLDLGDPELIYYKNISLGADEELQA